MFRPILLFFYFHVSIFASFAQNIASDSLENLLNKHQKADTARISLLNKTAKQLLGSDMEKTLKYLIEAKELSEKLNDKKKLAANANIFGIYYAITSNYPKSEKSFEFAIQLYNEIGDSKGISTCYNNMGLLNTQLGNYTQALDYSRKALAIEKKSKDTKAVSESYNNIGRIYFNKGEYNKALEYYNKALVINIENKDKFNIAKNYNNMGLISKIKGNYPLALQYLQNSLIIKEKLGMKGDLVSCYNNIGVIYNTVKEYDKALEYFMKMLKIEEELGDKEGMSNSYGNIGNVYLDENNLEKASEYAYKSLELTLQLEDKEGIAQDYNTLGEISLKQKKLNEAIDFFVKSLKISTNNDLQLLQAKSYAGLGIVYFHQQKIAEACKNSLIAYEIASRIGDIEDIVVCSETLSKCFAAKGNYKKAYEFSTVYKKMNDSIQNDNYTRKIVSLEYDYKHTKEQEITKIVQAKKDGINKAELKRQKVIRNSFLIGFLLITMLFILLYRNYIQKRKSNQLLTKQKLEILQKNKELVNLNEEVHSQNEQLARANNEIFLQKEEIQSQAENLSDALANLKKLSEYKEGMTSMIVHDLKNPISAILNIPENYSLDEKIEIVRFYGNQMLNLVLNILDINKYEDTKMPLNIQTEFLLTIANKAVSQIQFLLSQKNITIIKDIPENTIVKSDSEILERVFINILSNAIKYSNQNSQIYINCESAENSKELKISIKDEGIGIPVPMQHLIFQKFGQVIARKSGGIRSSGIGLTFCKLAIEAHDGKIDFYSEENKGTTFWFTLQKGNSSVNINYQPEVSQTITEKIQFDLDEMKYIDEKKKELLKFEIYEITDLMSIIESIEENNSKIKEWKNLLVKKINNFDEIGFKEMIRL